jgi:hypothetical protein
VDAAKMKEMILQLAQKKNPSAATVLTNESGADPTSIARALAAAQSLAVEATAESGGRVHPGPAAASRPLHHHHPHHLGPEKVYYELHVGGVPNTIESEAAFMGFLNEMVHKRGLNVGAGDPIVAVRINPSGHFAFVQFRTKEEATLGLGLSGVQCLGSVLRCERPKGYNKAGPRQRDDTQLLAAAILAAPVPQVHGLTREELKRQLEEDRRELGDPSVCVELQDMITLEMVQDAAEAADIAEDVSEQCAQHGTVVKVWMPVKPGQGVLVRMASIAEAQKVFGALTGKTFDGRKIRCRFRPATESDSRDADADDKADGKL